MEITYSSFQVLTTPATSMSWRIKTSCHKRRRASSTMRLENFCERETWILQIDIMGAFFGVSLNFMSFMKVAPGIYYLEC